MTAAKGKAMYSISVIVPVYKAEKYLPLCLESIAAQTVFDKIQLILVDDGSPDGSGSICDEFAKKHSNTFVIHKKNGGVSSARNAGLDAATGEYIGFVDSDDTIAPDYYEKLYSAAEKYGCDMAFGSFVLIYKNERRISEPWHPTGTVIDKSGIKGFAEKMLCDGTQNSVWSKLFKTSIIKDHEINFPVGVKIGEDKIFVLQFLRYCNSAVCTGDNGYNYMDVGSSAMHSDKKMAELLSVYDREAEMFIALGLDKDTVYKKKSVFLFNELTDFFQRCYTNTPSQAKAAIKLSFDDNELMSRIDVCLDDIKADSGRIFRLLAEAFEKRNITKTMITLALQNIITKIGERK